MHTKHSFPLFFRVTAAWFLMTASLSTLALTPAQQQAHVNWMFQQVNATSHPCSPAAGTLFMRCARTPLPVATVQNAWESNANLGVMTRYPATSTSSRWTLNTQGNPVRVYAHADGATYSVTLVPGADGTEIHLRYLSSGESLALPVDSRLARLIHPAAPPTYAGPLKPPEYRTADMDGLRGNVSSVITRSYDVKSDGRRTLTRTQVSRYDARGRLVSVSGLDNAGRLTFTDAYAFEGNLLKRQTFRNEAGTFLHAFTYDAQGHWRERKSFGADGRLNWLIKVVVFPNGYEQTVYGADGAVFSRRRVLLNRLGVQVASEDHQGEASDPRTVYENDRLVRHIFGSEQSGFMIVTEFDPRTGEKLKSTVSSTHLGLKVNTFTCEARDTQGNCTRVVERTSGYGSSQATEVSGILERTIRYHSAR